jgi:hypothetical protein
VQTNAGERASSCLLLADESSYVPAFVVARQDGDEAYQYVVNAWHGGDQDRASSVAAGFETAGSETKSLSNHDGG